jgi:hypothetical protein
MVCYVLWRLPVASPTHYPTFRRRTEAFYRYLARRKADLIRINGITDPQLTQLNTMLTAVEAVATGDGWPKYGEQP